MAEMFSDSNVTQYFNSHTSKDRQALRFGVPVYLFRYLVFAVLFALARKNRILLLLLSQNYTLRTAGKARFRWRG
jgi:hypothetical protein